MPVVCVRRDEYCVQCIRGSLAWVAIGIFGFSRCEWRDVCTGLDLAHRRLTPDITYICSWWRHKLRQLWYMRVPPWGFFFRGLGHKKISNTLRLWDQRYVAACYTRGARSRRSLYRGLWRDDKCSKLANSSGIGLARRKLNQYNARHIMCPTRHPFLGWFAWFGLPKGGLAMLYSYCRYVCLLVWVCQSVALNK